MYAWGGGGGKMGLTVTLVTADEPAAGSLIEVLTQPNSQQPIPREYTIPWSTDGV